MTSSRFAAGGVATKGFIKLVAGGWKFDQINETFIKQYFIIHDSE